MSARALQWILVFLTAESFIQEKTCPKDLMHLHLKPDERQVISSPHFPSEFYGPDEECNWMLKAPEGFNILYEVDFLSLAGPANCSEDYIEVSDDGHEWTGYCGKIKPDKSITSGNILYVRFISDGKDGDEGFLMSAQTRESNQPSTTEPTTEPDVAKNKLTIIFATVAVASMAILLAILVALHRRALRKLELRLLQERGTEMTNVARYTDDRHGRAAATLKGASNAPLLQSESSDSSSSAPIMLDVAHNRAEKTYSTEAVQGSPHEQHKQEK